MSDSQVFPFSHLCIHTLCYVSLPPTRDRPYSPAALLMALAIWHALTNDTLADSMRADRKCACRAGLALLNFCNFLSTWPEQPSCPRRMKHVWRRAIQPTCKSVNMTITFWYATNFWNVCYGDSWLMQSARRILSILWREEMSSKCYYGSVFYNKFS